MAETKILVVNDEMVIARDSQNRLRGYGYSSIMERKLRESEKWQAAVLNNIGDAVIATDEKGIIKLINPFAEALTGWSKNDSVGKPLKVIFNIINDKTGREAENPVIKVWREGAFFGLSEHAALHNRYGMEIPVDIIGTPVLDDRHKIIGMIFVFYDILDRKKMEHEFFFGKHWANMGFKVCRSSMMQRKLNDFFIETPKLQ